MSISYGIDEHSLRASRNESFRQIELLVSRAKRKARKPSDAQAWAEMEASITRLKTDAQNSGLLENE